jgi:AcrR family transcriptional regulator
LIIQNKKDHIIASAMQLFSEKGFDAVSVREIAGLAEANIALISYHFGSKEGLLQEIVASKARMMNAFIREIDADKSLTEIEKINKIIGHYVSTLIAHRQFHRVMVHEMLFANRDELHTQAINTFTENIQCVAAIIKRGIKKGIFKKVDPEMCFSSILGSIHHFINASKLRTNIYATKPGKDPINEKSFEQRIITHLENMMTDHLLKS